jgi:hypothetical protein
MKRTDYVYFAHAMSDYGTFWEAQAMMKINEEFGKPIMNPAQRQFEKGWQKYGMDYFKKFMLPRCDTLVYTSFPDYTIGSGVGYEVNSALNAGIKVYRMSRGFHGLVKVSDPTDHLTREETRARIIKYSEEF